MVHVPERLVAPVLLKRGEQHMDDVGPLVMIDFNGSSYDIPMLLCGICRSLCKEHLAIDACKWIEGKGATGLSQGLCRNGTRFLTWMNWTFVARSRNPDGRNAIAMQRQGITCADMRESCSMWGYPGSGHHSSLSFQSMSQDACHVSKGEPPAGALLMQQWGRASTFVIEQVSAYCENDTLITLCFAIACKAVTASIDLSCSLCVDIDACLRFRLGSVAGMQFCRIAASLGV